MHRPIIADTYASSMRSWVSYRFQIDFDVYVWMGENDAKTPGVDANFFENEEKKLRFQTNTDTCGQGLIVFCRAVDWPTVNFRGMYCYFPVIRLVNFV